MFQAGPKIDQDTQVSPALNFSTCFMKKHENYETSRIRKMGGPGPNGRVVTARGTITYHKPLVRLTCWNLFVRHGGVIHPIFVLKGESPGIQRCKSHQPHNCCHQITCWKPCWKPGCPETPDALQVSGIGSFEGMVSPHPGCYIFFRCGNPGRPKASFATIASWVGGKGSKNIYRGSPKMGK